MRPNIIVKKNDIKAKKMRKAQAKYMNNLTFTTEKHAKTREANNPMIERAKKAPYIVFMTISI